MRVEIREFDDNGTIHDDLYVDGMLAAVNVDKDDEMSIDRIVSQYLEFIGGMEKYGFRLTGATADTAVIRCIYETPALGRKEITVRHDRTLCLETRHAFDFDKIDEVSAMEHMCDRMYRFSYMMNRSDSTGEYGLPWFVEQTARCDAVKEALAGCMAVEDTEITGFIVMMADRLTDAIHNGCDGEAMEIIDKVYDRFELVLGI